MILKYQKIIDDYTTRTLIEPHYQEDAQRITELCTIGDDTYVHVPDSMVLPEQPFDMDVTMESIVLTDEMRAEISAVSPHMRLINTRVVEKIRKKYSENDEMKMLRQLAQGAECQEYIEHIESCRAWGRTEKEKIGL
ncbi:MAG: hypothetical protein HON48_14260 [Desulfobacula sp.]|nr:hypothetical protein [Desulfobacula sp.]